MHSKLSGQKGSALVTAIMVFAVLSVLGVAMLSISLSETKFVSHQHNKAQAYYIAHSSVDALATYIIKNPGGLTDQQLNDYVTVLKGGVTASESDFLGGSYTLSTAAENTHHLRLSSVGTYRNVSQKVSLLVEQRGLFDNAIYAHRSLTLWSGAKVYGGDVQYGETIFMGNNTEVIDGIVREGELEYPENEFPDTPPADPLVPDVPMIPGDLSVENNDTLTMTEEQLALEYDNISIKSRGTLVIDTGSDPNGVKKLVVSNMVVDGTFRIIGSGRLLLYVRDEVRFRGFNDNTPESLIVYIGDYNATDNPSGSKGYIELKTGNSIFNGYIMGIHAVIDVTANLVYTGAIISDTVKVASNAEVYYDKDKAALINPLDISLPPLGFKAGPWSD